MRFASYLVLYADVLGQREQLRALDSAWSGLADPQKALRVLRQTAGFLLRIRREFEDYFRAYLAEGHVPGLSGRVRRAMRAPGPPDLSCRYFSDSVVVSVSLMGTDHEGYRQAQGVLAALLAGCSMQVLALALGKALRCGVDIGWGLTLPGGEVYGAAMERAVTLEDSVAGYPRIAVGAELERFVDATLGFTPRSPYGEAAQLTARWCRDLLFKDHDGQVALDFLGPVVKSFDQAGALAGMVPRALEFARAEHRRWEGERNAKLANRYGWLLSYFRSRASLWGLDE